MKYNRSINKYLKTAESVCNKCKQFEYEEIRKSIKEQYESDSKFKSIQNIKLELERIINNIESYKLPYMNMVITISVACITILINNVLVSSLQTSIQLKNAVLTIYILIIIIAFGSQLVRLERKNQCLYIAKSVLEEMLQEKEELKLNQSIKEIEIEI